MSTDSDRANVDSVVKARLDASLEELEGKLGADAVTYYGPIVYRSDDLLRRAIGTIGVVMDKVSLSWFSTLLEVSSKSWNGWLI